jgi:hypothetical protein
MLSYFGSTQTAGGNAYKLQYLPRNLRNVTPVNAVRDEYIANALQYEYCLYALFSYMASRLYHVTKLRLKGLKDPSYYHAKSIALLRERLEECQNTGEPIDNATIGAIVQIALADWTKGDLAAARIHLKTLADLMQYVDISTPTGRFMSETIRTADFQVAVEGDTQPLLSAVPSFEPVSRERIIQLEKEVANDIQSSPPEYISIAAALGESQQLPEDVLADLPRTLTLRMGYALEEILKTDTIINPALHHIIRNMLDCLTVAKAVWILQTATLKDTGWHCRTFRTQGHWLFTYGYAHAYDTPTPRNLLTDCLRLALLIALSLCTNRMASRAAQNIDHRLLLACQKYEMGSSVAGELGQNTYLWCLLTGALVAEEGSDVKMWFMSRAADAVVMAGLEAFDDVHEAMSGFLWSWTYYLPTVRGVLEIVDLRSGEVWDDMEMGR